jgi:outer membrane protein assembly factor BamB
MNKYIISILFSLSTFAVAQNALSDQEKKEGWQLLFDGKSLEHWRNFKKETISPKWIVKEGAMVKTKGGGDIVTKKKYQNFDLKLDWKIAIAGNSGIFILANETVADKKIYTRAPEIQILDNEKHSDRKSASHRSGSLYDMIAAPDSSQKPAGEWNTLRVLFDNRHLQVWQNGVVAFDVKLGSEAWKKALNGSKFKNWPGFADAFSGHIGVQEHGADVSLRNIKIKPLPATAAAETAPVIELK